MKKLLEDASIFAFVAVVTILVMRGMIEAFQQLIDWFHT